ncbi:PREDICTED: sodium/potassium/calcium exchanger 1-like [Amphimedon queenslandica]|uniref:Uncharacterized protein n=1 Tax=Amphimedon queenslandica TaxID=400682 RepID=A0AAN0J727_AMPQE|nr:PREDICTED: sodium/potassium/calcium exchanger 1-like [Amphimedon queenslandica]|eukprot:XP_019852824.1 PREDICTED: sodium/potassium/calcium exchanger 1-like [Amphimedon queenslandica]
MNWENYGLRIGVQEDSLSCTDTVEAAVVALVGGQFQFPPNTVLVSAVYAVSLSKPLLKRLKLEVQHCVDLTGRPALSRHLKFAIAPMSTPSLPYQFSIVEGGEFKPDSWYGSIQRKEFCLVAIVGEKHLLKSSTNGDESEDEEEEELEEQAEEETDKEVEDGNSDSSSDSDETKDPQGGSSGGQGESTSNEGVEEEGETGGQPLHDEGTEEQDNERVEESKDHEEPQHEEANAPIPCTETSSEFNSKMVLSTGIVENMTYAGQVYYEEK